MGTDRKIRKCDGCINLNKRKKKQPCSIYTVKYEQGLFLRPYQCKQKYQKQDNKKNIEKLKLQVIDLFQMYIRYRDNFTCCCCGKHINPDSPDSKKLLHAGHFVSRSVKQLLLNEKNVNAQCRDCNGRQNWMGIDPRYCDYMLKKYGNNIFAELSEIMSKPYIEPDWESLRKHYTLLLKSYLPKKSLF